MKNFLSTAVVTISSLIVVFIIFTSSWGGVRELQAIIPVVVVSFVLLFILERDFVKAFRSALVIIICALIFWGIGTFFSS